LKDYGEFLSTDVASGIGTVRVQFRRVPCKECTVMAIQHNDSFAPLNFNMRVADTTGDGKVDKVVAPRLAKLRPLARQSTAEVLDHGDDPENRTCDPCGCCEDTPCAAVFEAFGREELYELEESRVSAAKIFEDAQKDENRQHMRYMWIGWGCFVVGIFLMLNVIPELLAAVPGAFGAWGASDGIRKVGGFIAFLMGLVLGSIFFYLTKAVSWLLVRPMKTFGFLAIVAGLAFALSYLQTPAAQETLNKFL